MKPKVAILGHWNPMDVPSRCSFDFYPQGYAHNVIPTMDTAALGKLVSEHDLIIIQDLGRAICHDQGRLEGWRGGRAKIVLWIQDVMENHKYLIYKQDLVDRIAVAHSNCLSALNGNSFWLPCSVVFHARKDFRRPSVMRWNFACIARFYSQWDRRGKILDRWRECFEAWGLQVILGECNSAQVPFIYGSSETVFNVPSAGDLNMRTFEALASGATLFTTDCPDLHHERFADLMPAVWIAPATLNEEELRDSVEAMRLSKRYPVQKRALEKHLLVNRYIEIAEHVL